MKIGIQTSGTTGDIRPFIQLADGLSKAGNEVTLLISTIHRNDFSKYQKYYDFKIIDPVPEECYQCADILRDIPEYKPTFFSNMDAFTRQASGKLCVENEIVIGNQGAYYLQAHAEKRGIPYVTLSLNHSLIPTRFKPYIALGNDSLGEEANIGSWKEVETTINDTYAPYVNEFRETLGLPKINNLFREVTHSPSLDLIGVSKVLCEEQADWKDHRYVCGYFFWDEPGNLNHHENLPSDLIEFISGENQPIFFSLGSLTYFTPDLIKIINNAIRCASDLKRRIIVQTTWDTIPPGEILINKDVYPLPMGVDHRVILPLCAVMIHHGGTGTTHTALLCECPSIILEDGADMTMWGYLLNQLGVAPIPISATQVKYDILKDRLNSALSSPQMKERAIRLSKIMQSENPIAVAINAIHEKFAH
jgi:sterol 3beta-glucosyltransferase